MIRFRRRADLQLRYASSPIRAIFQHYEKENMPTDIKNL